MTKEHCKLQRYLCVFFNFTMPSFSYTSLHLATTHSLSLFHFQRENIHLLLLLSVPSARRKSRLLYVQSQGLTMYSPRVHHPPSVPEKRHSSSQSSETTRNVRPFFGMQMDKKAPLSLAFFNRTEEEEEREGKRGGKIR